MIVVVTSLWSGPRLIDFVSVLPCLTDTGLTRNLTTGFLSPTMLLRDQSFVSVSWSPIPILATHAIRAHRSSPLPKWEFQRRTRPLGPTW